MIAKGESGPRCEAPHPEPGRDAERSLSGSDERTLPAAPHRVRRAAADTIAEATACAVLHEVNQVLFTIVNHAQAALDELDQPVQDPDRLQDRLDSILATGLGWRSRANDLRWATRRPGPSPRTVDLNRLVRETATEYLPPPEKAVRVESRCQTDRAEIVGDVTRLRLALEHLLDNAVEALPDAADAQHSIIVAVTVHPERRQVEIDVKDRGCGVPRELNGNPCDAFRSGKPNHLGLGLTVVRAIVRSHGGLLSLEPAPGGGTVASLTLPLCTDR